ncbi:MAG TPA: 16S rRNA (cytosine(967)-C(5))-methyltransferase RsmB [Pyrinomonadaceae bacterium]|nr:16S rRNA (cytosine(967)-C(5))-methyltransferase RsmB [Pyrinomonadaceae bacterium]
MVRNRVSPARWAAFEILRKVEDGVFSSVLLARESQLDPPDQALCHELVLGVLRWQLNLDKVIEHYSNRSIETLDKSVLIALRLGLYQLRFLTRVPASAAVDESVKLVHTARLSSARSFVNAVLRRATREPLYDPSTSTSNPIERIAIQTSHPYWLIERWVNSFGQEETELFARANNETPPTAFRIVRTKANQSEVLAKLSAAQVAFESSDLVQDAWRASSGSRILRELAESGEVYLQDEASQLVAEIVAAHPGERVLDLCAAPGGKATLIADRTNAFVVASDVSRQRLATVGKSVATQQLKGISLTLLDASQPLPFQYDSFDRVLVDAPCSGTGTLRHNPEIRWRISSDDIKSLAAQQRRFLINAAKAVKAGGRLIYSTCSVEKEENEEVVEQFLQSHKNFRQISLRTGSILATPSGALRTWPHRDGTDGFFVAVLEK